MPFGYSHNKILSNDTQLKGENMEKDKKAEGPSCKNCEWAGCKDYGKDKHSCDKYIKEME